MYIAPNRPWQLPPNYDNVTFYNNKITDDEISFEYYDDKDFIENEPNGIYKLVEDHNSVTFIIINIKSFSRLVKMCALQKIDTPLINEVFYYIENCDSKKFKEKVLYTISQF